MQFLLKLTDEEKNLLVLKVKKIIGDRKGILAVDERPITVEAKFTARGVANTSENRCKFRACLFKTPDLEKYVGGAILHEETLEQSDHGVPLVEILKKKGIEIGVKVDKGLMDFGNGEKISVGLEDLENRLQSYKDVSFCKWRSFFIINSEQPTDNCIEQNCIVLCKYGLIAQQNGLVPILEPEISFNGDYTLEDMKLVARRIYGTLFQYACRMNLFLPGLIMKCSFLYAGNMCNTKVSMKELGIANTFLIAESVPIAIGGIVFLSGGHKASKVFELLKSIHENNAYQGINFSFSFCRALTQSVYDVWTEEKKMNEEAQKILLERLEECKKANTPVVNELMKE
ncbi:hypothetical protein GINT2_000871 [Glugoides intestinalis]